MMKFQTNNGSCNGSCSQAVSIGGAAHRHCSGAEAAQQALNWFGGGNRQEAGTRPEGEAISAELPSTRTKPGHVNHSRADIFGYVVCM